MVLGLWCLHQPNQGVITCSWLFAKHSLFVMVFRYLQTVSKKWTNFVFCCKSIFQYNPFIFSGFVGNTMIFVICEMQLDKWNGFYWTAKIKIVQFWYESKFYVQVRLTFCREFNVHTRDGPKNNAIKRFVKHFKDYRVPQGKVTRGTVDGQQLLLRTRQTSTRYAIPPSTVQKNLIDVGHKN